jgi:tetratricopeptide (TPR) repeat protein
MLNHTIGPVDYQRDRLWQRQVVAHYRANLDRMAAIAKRCGAKMILVRPPVNEKACSPFKSQFHDTTSQEDRANILAWIGQSVIDDEPFLPDRLDSLKRAAELDPDHALAQYRLGQVLFRQKEYEQAKQAFQKAIDEDVCPLRATSAIRRALEDAASQHHLPLILLDDLLRQDCLKAYGHDVLGEEYFLDHVHPTIDVHRTLALGIISAMQREQWIGGVDLLASSMRERIASVQAKVLSEVDTRAQGISLRNLAKVFHWSGKYAEAEPLARDAIEMLGECPESRFVLADSLKNLGRPKLAAQQYERLYEVEPHFGKGLQPYGELLASLGEFKAAKAYLMAAVLREPDKGQIYHSLGLVHWRLGEIQFARESLVEAQRCLPDDQPIRNALERLQNSTGGR